MNNRDTITCWNYRFRLFPHASGQWRCPGGPRGPWTPLWHSQNTDIFTSSLLSRRMFPSVRVKVRNLDPCQQYYIAMDVMPVDSKRYRCVECVYRGGLGASRSCVDCHVLRPPAGTCTTARSGWWPGTRTTRASLPGSTCTRTRRARERRGCVRSSASTGSNSPTTRWTIRGM